MKIGKARTSEGVLSQESCIDSATIRTGVVY